MIGRFVTSRLGIGLASAVALGILYLLWSNAAAERDLAKERLEVALATITDLSLDLQINQAASAERAADETRIGKLRKELTDAGTVPGDGPHDSELRSLCVLRQQQSGVDGLPPECRGFDLED
ncbi:MAG: hypothetical protein AAFR88_10405 [Pseudomonadota bacterium]